jgi:hypothetical protein
MNHGERHRQAISPVVQQFSRSSSGKVNGIRQAEQGQRQYVKAVFCHSRSG